MQHNLFRMIIKQILMIIQKIINMLNLTVYFIFFSKDYMLNHKLLKIINILNLHDMHLQIKLMFRFIMVYQAEIKLI